MSAIKITESTTIKENLSIVFDFTQDYTNRLLWDTFLKRAELTDGATAAAKGVRAYCVAKNGFGMITEYVTFNRPRVTAIKMTKGPFMFKTFLGSWSFKEHNENETEVVFLYSFTLRFPFNIAVIFIKRNLQNNVKQRLVDLKICIENKQSAK